MTKHKWALRSLYTSSSGGTFELLRCEHCGQEKLGAPKPGEHGPMGPYNVYNGRDTCPTREELAEREARAEAHRQEYLAARRAEEAALKQRREQIRALAAAQGLSAEDYPFSREEAKALYDAGYHSGLERGADGGSFEAALRALGR